MRMCVDEVIGDMWIDVMHNIRFVTDLSNIEFFFMKYTLETAGDTAKSVVLAYQQWWWSECV